LWGLDGGKRGKTRKSEFTMLRHKIETKKNMLLSTNNKKKEESVQESKGGCLGGGGGGGGAKVGIALAAWDLGKKTPRNNKMHPKKKHGNGSLGKEWFVGSSRTKKKEQKVA